MANVPRRRAPHPATPEPFYRARVIQLLLRCYSEDERFQVELAAFYSTHCHAFDRRRMSDSTRQSIESVAGLVKRLDGIEWFGQHTMTMRQMNETIQPDDKLFWNTHDRNAYREVADGIRASMAWSYLTELDLFAEKWGLDRIQINNDCEGRETIHLWFLARLDNRDIQIAEHADRSVYPQDFWRFLPVSYMGPVAVPPELRIDGQCYQWWPELEDRRDARKRLHAAAGDRLTSSAIDAYLNHVMSSYEERGFAFPQASPQLVRNVGLLYRRLAYREHPEDVSLRANPDLYGDGGDIEPPLRAPDNPAGIDLAGAFSFLRDRLGADRLSLEDIKNRTNDLARDLNMTLPSPRSTFR